MLFEKYLSGFFTKIDIPIILSGFLFVFFPPSMAGAGSAIAPPGNYILSLEDCLKLGIENNPGLQGANFMVDEAGEDINAARSDFLPSLSAGTSWSSINSVDASGPTDQDYIDQENLSLNARISQTIYAGSRRLNAYKRAKASREMYAAEKDYIAAELSYEIKVGFFQLMKAVEDVRVAVDNVKRLEADAASAQAFYEKQMTSYAHVLQARVDLADARQELSILQNTVDRKRSDLFVFMNQPFNKDITFSGGLGYYKPGFTMTQEQCFNRAVENRPDLKSLEYQVGITEKDVSISMGKYLPQVTLDAGYYDYDKDYDNLLSTYDADAQPIQKDIDQHNKYWTAGVNVSWNLFDGGRAWHEKNKYRIEIKRLKASMDELKSRIQGGITSALFSLSEAEQRITTTAEAIGASNEYYERESKRFQAGIATIASVLDAQVRVKRAEGNHNQALLDYQLARAELDFLTGENSP